MKANEFVKEHGLDEARKIVDGYKFAFHPSFDHWSIKHNDYYLIERDYTVAIADLKRLVESHELVAEFDDIEQAKSWVAEMESDVPYNVSGSRRRFTRDELSQAIADVELCQ